MKQVFIAALAIATLVSPACGFFYRSWRQCRPVPHRRDAPHR